MSFHQHYNIRINVLLQHVSTQSCETFHPGTQEGTLQKGQEHNPTHRRSEEPYHNLEKTGGYNIELRQCLINRGQGGAQKNRQ